MFMRRLVLFGFGLWLAATLILRVGGETVLRPGSGLRVPALFVVSFLASAWIVRALCGSFLPRRECWPAGAIAILLPTLLLDSFSSAYFPVVFPNMAPEMAGVFGGWMLWCCAAGLLAALPPRD